MGTLDNDDIDIDDDEYVSRSQSKNSSSSSGRPIRAARQRSALKIQASLSSSDFSVSNTSDTETGPLPAKRSKLPNHASSASSVAHTTSSAHEKRTPSDLASYQMGHTGMFDPLALHDSLLTSHGAQTSLSMPSTSNALLSGWSTHPLHSSSSVASSHLGLASRTAPQSMQHAIYAQASDLGDFYHYQPQASPHFHAQHPHHHYAHQQQPYQQSFATSSATSSLSTQSATPSALAFHPASSPYASMPQFYHPYLTSYGSSLTPYGASSNLSAPAPPSHVGLHHMGANMHSSNPVAHISMIGHVGNMDSATSADEMNSVSSGAMPTSAFAALHHNAPNTNHDSSMYGHPNMMTTTSSTSLNATGTAWSMPGTLAMPNSSNHSGSEAVHNEGADEGEADSSVLVKPLLRHPIPLPSTSPHQSHSILNGMLKGDDEANHPREPNSASSGLQGQASSANASMRTQSGTSDAYGNNGKHVLDDGEEDDDDHHFSGHEPVSLPSEPEDHDMTFGMNH
jgi:hypothetical protein